LIGPALAHLCLRAVGLKGQTPARAMIEDYLVCRRPWGFALSDVRVPVTLWHGRADSRGGHFFYSRSIAEIIRSLEPDDLIETPEPSALAA
jgi:hypothetical protein